MNTRELQELINNNDYVRIPSGIHETGPLFLHSDMTIELERGAVLLATIDESAYKDISTRVAGIEMKWYPGVLNAINCNNVIIKGRGQVNGNGPYWYKKYWGEDGKGGMRKEYDARGIRFLCDYDCKRPRNILIQSCHNVDISGITSKDSGFWNIHVLYSKKIHINDVKIDSANKFSPSTDGIDIDSSNDVLIEKIESSTNDDSIAIKSGRDADGLRVGIPSYNIRIQNCLIKKGFGITLGSELSGGIHDVTIDGIRYEDTDCAFRIKSSNMRKGYVKNITVNNLKCVNVKYLFHINLNWNPDYNKCVIPDSYHGEIKDYYAILLKTDNRLPDTLVDNITIKNVIATTTRKYTGISRVFHLEGLTSAHIKRILFSHLNVRAREYGYIVNTDYMTVEKSEIVTDVECIPENNNYDNR